MSTRKYSVGIKKTKFVLLQSFAEGSEGALSFGAFASVSLKNCRTLENMFWIYRVVQSPLTLDVEQEKDCDRASRLTFTLYRQTYIRAARIFQRSKSHSEF